MFISLIQSYHVIGRRWKWVCCCTDVPKPKWRLRFSLVLFRIDVNSCELQTNIQKRTSKCARFSIVFRYEKCAYQEKKKQKKSKTATSLTCCPFSLEASATWTRLFVKYVCVSFIFGQWNEENGEKFPKMFSRFSCKRTNDTQAIIKFISLVLLVDSIEFTIVFGRWGVRAVPYRSIGVCVCM